MSTAATESSTASGSNAALGIKAFVVNIGGIGQFFRQRPAINAEFRHQAGPEEVLQGEFVYYLLGPVAKAIMQKSAAEPMETSHRLSRFATEVLKHAAGGHANSALLTAEATSLAEWLDMTATDLAPVVIEILRIILPQITSTIKLTAH